MKAIDPFGGYANNPLHVYDNCMSVNPSDTDELPVVATTLYVTAPDEDAKLDVHVTTAGGQDITFAKVSGSLFVPVRIRKVWATGTTAANILALW